MDVIGGGVLVAAAAALWIAYLLPSWLRRRQYLATERNAVRLQQTLRILAETSETPEPVRVEATAREVSTQQRILHEHEQAVRLAAEAAEQLAIAERRVAEEAAEAAREIAASVRAPVTEPNAVTAPWADAPAASMAADVARADAARARRALRRRRGRFSLLLLASLLTVVGGLVAGLFGASLAIAIAGGGGAAGMVVAFAGLVRLARVRVPRVTAPIAKPDAEPFEPIDLSEPQHEDQGWMPQPLPKPLHLSRGTIAAMAMASMEEAAELKRAAVDAEVARRADELAPPLPSIPAAGAPATPAARRAQASAEQAAPGAARGALAGASERRSVDPASPYARMGIVDDARPAFDDLDAVLRRRRQVG
ncbi:hypothetical protein [Agromyces bauzanensis]|uniref:Large exoprotein n=1 Tax=Agromyces bauzanensis TaxID=1308924 RepID=A0A917PUM1_9MICO|nr:hypothetical protein [Agromyces bauzanensis]GGJ92421.1 hypothetical protein GCM10011372_33630 [Agromyces bauzanensis]